MIGLINCLFFVPRLDRPYTVPQECVVYADMSLMRGVTNLAAVGSVAGDSRDTTDLGQNPSAAPGMGKVVMGNL